MRETVAVELEGSAVHPNWMSVVVAGVLAAVQALWVFAPSAPLRIAFRYDTTTHILAAQHAWESGQWFPFSHWLYHVLVIGVYIIAPWLDWSGAGALVFVCSYVALVLLVFSLLRRTVRPLRRLGDEITVAALALALVLAGPVNLFTFSSSDLYFGYLNPDGYLSPTHALLRPLGIALFVLAVGVFGVAAQHTGGVAMLAMAILSTLAKPSLAICLVPALGVLAGAYWITGRPVRPRQLILWVLAPILVILGYQYVVTFAFVLPSATVMSTPLDEPSHIMFAPLLVWSAYSSWLGPKFVLSILFPLTVVLMYPRAALSRAALQLAWLTFAISAFQTYMLAESREPLAGNFGWTSAIAINILLFASLDYAVAAWGRGTHGVMVTLVATLRSSWRARVCLLTFCLHVLGGLLYYTHPQFY